MTWFAGADMSQRREVLGRLAGLYVAIEGGPGTVPEAEVTASRNAAVIPVGRSGGHAALLYSWARRPPAIDGETWAVLGSGTSTPDQTARAVLRAVQACLAPDGCSLVRVPPPG